MKIQIEDWGVIDYMEAYARQRQIVDAVIAGGLPRLIFCEHPPVLTLGRMTKADSLIFSREDIEVRGVKVYPIDRGGDVTLHAPGQMVVYVIMDLKTCGKDLKVYLEKLEQVAVDLLKDFGILAISIPGKRGVFASPHALLSSESSGDRFHKIVSIGVGVRKWVTYHGLGINVSTDLSLFRLIRPCGLDVKMTSIEKLLGKPVDMNDVRNKFLNHIQKEFSND